MQDGHNCILAHVFGDYVTGLVNLGIGGGDDAVDYGYMAPIEAEGPQWDMLGAIWKELVVARKPR